MATTLGKFQTDILDAQAKAIGREIRTMEEIARLMQKRNKVLLKRSIMDNTTLSEERQITRLVSGIKEINRKTFDRIEDTAAGNYRLQRVASERIVTEQFDLKADIRAAKTVSRETLIGESVQKSLGTLEKKQKSMIADVIRLSKVEGLAPGRVASEITKITGYSRSFATMTARTNIMAASNMALVDTYQEHKDVIKSVQWSSTFDSDTCIICGGLDGRVWPVNQAQIPPAHPHCRCVLIPVVNESILPERRKDKKTHEDWLRNQSKSVQRTVFPSEKKFAAWRSGTPMAGRKLRSGRYEPGLVAKTGRIRTDKEVAKNLKKAS